MYVILKWYFIIVVFVKLVMVNIIVKIYDFVYFIVIFKLIFFLVLKELFVVVFRWYFLLF